MLSSKNVKMHECESIPREKPAGLEHGKGRESLCFWFIAPGSCGQSCCFCLFDLLLSVLACWNWLELDLK